MRGLSNILGFSKETLVALTTNIEGREWHRREVMNGNRRPEHPRASTTDDVECFFSLIRTMLGIILSPSKLNLMPAKSMENFEADLPFYYHTSGSRYLHHLVDLSIYWIIRMFEHEKLNHFTLDSVNNIYMKVETLLLCVHVFQLCMY